MEGTSSKIKAEVKVYAKFLVQKISFFGTVKRILTIHKTGLTLEAISKGAQDQENFSFSDLTVIEAPSRSENEIVIATKKNNTCSFFCYDRTKCICEIYYAWDRYILSVSPRLEKSFPSYEIFKSITPNRSDLYIEVQLVIFRTHLELTHKSLRTSNVFDERFTHIESSQSGVSPSVIIPFCQIKNIYKSHSSIIIESKNSLTRHTLLFYDLEKANNVISKIQGNYKEYVDGLINISFDDESKHGSEQTYVDIKSSSSFFYDCKVHKLLESGNVFPIKLAISDDYIVELDVNANNIVQKYDLRAVNAIVQLASGLPGICISFEDHMQVTYIPDDDEKEIIAANIFTLINWKKMTQDTYARQGEFIHCMVPNNRYKVQCWIDQEIEPEYEVELIKGFSSATSEDELYRILHEFNINATLKNYNDSDPKPLLVLTKLFCKNVKLLKSKQFIKYWESLQNNLNDSSPTKRPDIFESSESSRSFGRYEADDQFAIELNITPFLNILFKTEELLKAITILISSKPLFKEIVNNKKEATHYEEFLHDVISLINRPYPTLNHLAGSFFRAFCRFPFPVEKKTEALNKKYLLTGKTEILLALSKSLANKILKERTFYNQFENKSIHSILASLRILRTYVYDRKETTDSEDLQQVLRQISKAYYFSMINFLFRSHSIGCVYNATILLNAIFQNHEAPDLEKKAQDRFLHNSSLVPLNMILVFSSSLILQRKLSMILLSNVFAGNEVACELLLRIFPKYLFTKVDSASTYITSWDLEKWEQFFSILVQDYDTPTEQWNEECRKELLQKLREADEDLALMLLHCPSSKLIELFDPTFKNDGEFLLNIRWNHEEFSISYSIFESKVLVWRYFLDSLLQDGEKPSLATKITNPNKFWNDLNIKFITSENISESRKILKVMILTYQEYISDLLELTNLNFWLKSLKKKEYKDLRYLILQLIYCSFTVENANIAYFNLNKFIEMSGVSILADTLAGLYFNEDHNKLSISNCDVSKKNSGAYIDYNYTKLQTPKQGYTPSFTKAMAIYFILQIYKMALNKSTTVMPPAGEKLIYPMPKAKQQLLYNKGINCLINILLLYDDDLVQELLDILSTYFLDKESLDIISQKTPLFDFLLININQKTISTRFTLLLHIYHKIADQMPPEENPIKIYTSFSFYQVPPEVTEEALSLLPTLRYFPKYLIWKLINNGIEDFIQTFFSPSYETPQLIWDIQMREKLNSSIRAQIAPYKKDIINYVEANDVHLKEDLPDYLPEKIGVEYKNISDEVICGPIMVRIWTKKAFRSFELPKQEIPLFIKQLYSLLKESAKTPLEENDPKKISDLLTILAAHAKAIKLYSLKLYECFDEIVKILTYFAKRTTTWNSGDFPNAEILAQTSSFLLILHKIIHRTIRLDSSGNLKAFLEAKGFSVLVNVLKNYVKKVSQDESTEVTNYYSNLKLSFSDLKILSLSLRIIHHIQLKSPASLISLSSETKLQLFLNLQVISKVSTVLFEHIENQYDETQNRNLKKISHYSSVYGEERVREEGEGYDPVTACVFDIIINEPNSAFSDLYISKLISFTKHLAFFFVDLSVEVEVIPFFIQSGIAWRCLEWLTYYCDPNRYTRKIEDPTYQAITGCLDKVCNTLRNILIFTNEAYILKISSASVKSVNVGLTTTKKKSPQLLASLDKLDGFERTVLSKFHAAILVFVGKPILQLLLTDYYEPIVTPVDEDRDNILRFMKIFATSYHDPLTLWNEETRQELKELIMNQIIHINESHGKAFFNEVEHFEYKCYSKQLIIDGVFIASYNKTPEWKIVNPRQFIMKMLEAMSQIWEWIKESTSSNVELEDFNLTSELIKLYDAAAGIANIIAYHGSEEVLLFEGNLTRLGTLLNDQSLKQINNPYIPRLKSMVLSIFLNLSKKLNGALKVVENATIMRNSILILRENSKEGFHLGKKIVRIIENIFKFENLRAALVRYGLFVILLESCLKTEIFTKIYREKSLQLFSSIVQTNDPISLHTMRVLFPPFIQDLFKNNQIPLEEIMDILDKGSDTPKFMWTKFMRHEILLIIKKVCDTIEDNWLKYQNKEIKIIETLSFWDEAIIQEKPKFPELENNIKINGIFLKNFNRMPQIDGSDNIATIMINFVIKGKEILEELKEKMVISPKQIIFSDDNSGDLDQRKANRLLKSLVTLLTSIMLVIDQMISGSEKKISFESSKSTEDKKITDEFQEQKPQLFLDENSISFINECAGLITNLAMGSHYISVELQLLWLMIDDEKGFATLKAQNIVNTLSKILLAINQPNGSTLTHVEEKLVLHLLLKIIYKDNSLIPEVIDQCLTSLKKIFAGEKSSYLKDILESIVTLIAQDPEHGREAFSILNHEQELISVSTVHDCIPSKIIDAFWKPLAQGWNPYSAKNTINIIIQRSKENWIQCPLISDYSIQPLPYADEKNIEIEQILKAYISALTEAYSNSKECSNMD